MIEGSELPAAQLLERGNSVLVASIPGLSNPVAVVESKLLDELTVLCRDARRAIDGKPANAVTTAVLAMCRSLEEVLGPYALVRNKYYGNARPADKWRGVHQELDAAFREINRLLGKK